MSDALFNRSYPLFERKRVVCQVLSTPTTDKSNTSIGLRNSQNIFEQNIFYTLRVLDGTRSSQENKKCIERVIRIELSDECSKYELDCSNMDQRDNCIGEQNNFQTCHHSNNSAVHTPIKSHQSTLKKGSWSDNAQNMLFNDTASVTGQRLQNEDTTYKYSTSNTGIHIVDASPIKIYELEIGESDFIELRRDQALLIDFSEFARSFIELLALCDLECRSKCEGYYTYGQTSINDKNYKQIGNPLFGCQLNAHSDIMHNSKGRPNWGVKHTPIDQAKTNERFHKYQNDITMADGTTASNYKCRLESHSALSTNPSHANYSWNNKSQNNNRNIQLFRFSIVESNQFRELTHIALNLREGTDSSTRAYLSTRLSHSMGEIDQLNKSLELEHQRLVSAEKALSDAMDKQNATELMYDVERKRMNAELEGQLNEQQKQRDDDFRRLQEEKDEEIHLLQTNSSKEMKKRQEQFEEISAERNEMKKKIEILENNNQRLTDEIVQRKTLIDTLSNELSSMTQKVQTMQEEKRKTDEVSNQTQIHVGQVEQSAEQQAKKIQETENRLEISQQRSKEIEKRLEEKSSAFAVIKEKLSKLEVESAKEKRALRKYQEDREKMKKRMKSKVDLIRKQEEILIEKDKEIFDLHQNTEFLSDDSRKMTQVLEEKEKEAKDMMKNIDELKHIIESNQQVQWLWLLFHLYLLSVYLT